MGINIGAFFAPFAATAMRNWWLKANGFAHDGSLPAECHRLINGTLTNTKAFQELANSVSLSGPVTDLNAFAHTYLEVFSKGYNYAFGIAAGAMVISLLVYIFFKRMLPNKEKAVKTELSSGIELRPLPVLAALAAMIVTALGLKYAVGWASGFAFGLFAAFITWIILSSTKEEKARVTSLILVFIVVVFFWMSFHQNGLTMTLFARDYTVKQVGPVTNLFFTLPSLLSVIGSIAGLVLLIRRKLKPGAKIAAGVLFITALIFAYFRFSGAGKMNSISPEIFQSFNPLFIVALTFPVMGYFSWLNKKGIEPSTPGKIGIGMIIAAIGFIIVLLSSVSLPSPASLAGAPVDDVYRVSPYWLISSYLTLTIAELFLSPMGLSFVSKVAPSRFQGLMQGGWLLATAIGNRLLAVGTLLWNKVELWQLWLVFIVCCFASAAFIFSILKRLEKAAK
jgi:POT family proton-dependent oligopeptide transporter